jgi:hypothetical protein
VNKDKKATTHAGLHQEEIMKTTRAMAMAALILASALAPHGALGRGIINAQP